MINGFNHTASSTSTLTEGSVQSASPGFNGGLLGSNQSTGNAITSFSDLLTSDEGSLSSGLSETEGQDQVGVDVSEELLGSLETDAAEGTLGDELKATVLLTAQQGSQSGLNLATNAPASTASIVTDSIVSAVSNVMSTSATLVTAQVATSQLATNSALDSKLIDVAAVKDSAASTEGLVSNNAQSNRSETTSNLQFKAVLDKSLSAQQLGERLNSTIADKVIVQVNAKMPTATIRLDPPDLGKIDLVVRLDNDKLSIQINASSGATRESIQMTSDRLRAELVEQNFLHVDVSISGEHQQGSDHYEMMAEEDFAIATNSAATNSDAEEQIDNSELARA